MNALLQKESRILRPAQLVGLGILGLTTFTGGSVSLMAMNLTLAYWAACCLIVVTGFSWDWNIGGLTLALAQPISRREIWREKLNETLWAFAIQTAAFTILAAFLLSRTGRRDHYSTS
jgi:hypothetical protein